MIAIVILGAAVWADGPSPTLRRRAAHGAALFHAGQGRVVVPCGGEGPYPPSEADVMQTLLVSADVPAHVIHLEDRSTTTYENLRNARAILRRLEMRDVIIVTDTYHAPRSLLVARALGLKARVAAPANTGASTTLRLRRLRHEAVALPAYALGLIWWLWRDRHSP